jgi:small subunit ribosomal protein S4
MPRVLEKRERRLGTKLYIRGDRSDSPKRALVRKPYPPGQHGKRFHKTSEFGNQLQEKQKVKFSYGLTDKQLKRVFKGAASKPDSTIELVAQMLECRLDNVVMRLGFVQSRSIARQVVSHGHFLVNNKKVTTPSYQTKVGDVVSISKSALNNPMFRELKDTLKNYSSPSWLSIDKEKMEGKIESFPSGVDFPFNINLVVDYYSKK